MSRTGWRPGHFLAALAMVIAPGIAAVGLSRLRPPRPAPLPVMGSVPEFRLTSHGGEPIRRSDLHGFVWVADFFFTSCAGTCPEMKTQMRRVQKAFAQQPEVKLVSFTVDPETDTVGLLARYAEGWDAIEGRWFFVTGDKKAIYSLARKGFKVTAQPGDGGPEDFIHSDRFILVDRKGQIRGYYHGTDAESVNRLIAHIHLLLRERVSP